MTNDIAVTHKDFEELSEDVSNPGGKGHYHLSRIERQRHRTSRFDGKHYRIKRKE